MKSRILIIVAHPDDETIAMGSTIRKHADKGDDVVVISMTDGVSSREESNQLDQKNRAKSAIEASLTLGFKWGKCYNFSDNKMDSYPLLDIVKCLEIEKNNYKPELVYTHSNSDLNIDHRVIANAVLTAFRPQPNEYCKEIRLFEIPSATDFGNNNITGSFFPNLFIEVNEENWEYKLKALKKYKSEIRKYPHSRSYESIKNLARLRGNQVGLSMAEAFQIIRKIVS